MLLSETLAAAAGATRRGPQPHDHGVVTWRIMAPGSAQASLVGALVLVTVVAGLQVVAGQITAGEVLAASQYAALGAGLGNLTAVLGDIAPR